MTKREKHDRDLERIALAAARAHPSIDDAFRRRATTWLLEPVEHGEIVETEASPRAARSPESDIHADRSAIWEERVATHARGDEAARAPRRQALDRSRRKEAGRLNAPRLT
jgi:hypothetical protein